MNEYKEIPLIQFQERELQKNRETKFWRKFRLEFKKQFEENCSFLRVNDKRKFFCVGNQNAIQFYKYKDNSLFFEYNREKEPIRDFAIRNDGQLSVFSNSSGYVKILNLKHKNLLKSFKFSEQPIYGVNIADKNPIVIAGDDQGNFKVHEFSTDTNILTISGLHTDFLRTVKFLDQSQFKVITGSMDRTSKIIDLKTHEILLTINNEIEIEDLLVLNENEIAIAGGTQLKIWDLRNYQNPFKNITVSNKTISSLTLQQGKIIVTSFDKFLKVLSVKEDFKILSSIKFDHPITHFAINNQMTSYSIAFNNNKIQFFKKSEEEDKEDIQKEFSPEEELMKKLFLGVGKKEENSYKYFNRGVWELPEDFTVKIGKPFKIKRPLYEQYLKKFQFDKALEMSLKTNNTVIIISLLEELMIRNFLESTIKKINLQTVQNLLKFILKKIDSLNTLNIVLETFQIILDIQISNFQQNEELQELVSQINKKLKTEIKTTQKSLDILNLIRVLENQLKIKEIFISWIQ